MHGLNDGKFVLYEMIFQLFLHEFEYLNILIFISIYEMEIFIEETDRPKHGRGK